MKITVEMNVDGKPESTTSEIDDEYSALVSAMGDMLGNVVKPEKGFSSLLMLSHDGGMEVYATGNGRDQAKIAINYLISVCMADKAPRTLASGLSDLLYRTVERELKLKAAGHIATPDKKKIIVAKEADVDGLKDKP